MVFKEFFRKIVVALFFASTLGLVASNHKDEKKRSYEESYGQGCWSNSENKQGIKKRKLQVIKKQKFSEEFLEKIKKAKKVNENNAICTVMPVDAWAVVGEFLVLKDLLSLKLVSAYFRDLFYKSEYDEFPKICLPKLILPSIMAGSEQGELQVRKKVADFLEKSCLSHVKGKPENFVFPVKGGVWGQVEHLDLERSKITDSQLSVILKRLPHLKSLNLKGCNALTFGIFVDGSKMIEEGLNKESENFKDLQELSKINAMDEPDRSLHINKEYEKHSPNVKYFSVMDWSSVKEIETLNITDTNITTQGLQAILDNCLNLRDLRACDCNELVLEDLNWGNAKKIVELDLSENFITTAGLQKLLNSCPHLKILKLRECSGFLAGAIDWVVVGELFALDLGGSVRVSNKTLKEIGIACPKLSVLFLANQVSEESDAFCGSDVNWETGLDWGLFKNLTELDLDFNDYVTSKGVEKILKNCSKLKVLRGFFYQGDSFSVDNITLFSRLNTFVVQLFGEVQSPLRMFFEALSKNSSLKELSIDGISLQNQSSGIIWGKVGKTLEKLNITFSRLTHGEFQAIINGCLCLEELTFASGHSTFESMKGLDWKAVSKKLFSLDLSTNVLSKEALQPVLDACVGLKKLVLDECEGIDIGAFDWTKLSCLESLSLSDSPISAQGLLLILESCPALNYLYLGVDNDLEVEEFYDGSAQIKVLRDLLKKMV